VATKEAWSVEREACSVERGMWGVGCGGVERGGVERGQPRFPGARKWVAPNADREYGWLVLIVVVW
jgi:hypothetical protein